MISKNTRGSEWRKWDLHIHTPFSRLNNNYSCSDDEPWGKFCDILESSDVAAFGITDYFSFENYTTFITRFKAKYPLSTKVFFPNIEFRIDSQNRNGVHINIHVIFSNNDDTLRKIPDFLTRLKLISTDNVDLTNKFCTSSDLNELGYGRAMVSMQNLTSQLSDNFSSNEEYLIVGVANGHGCIRPNADDSRSAEHAKEIDKICDLFFGNPNNVDFFLNKKAGREQYKLQPKAVICGCDAHSFTDLEQFLGKWFEDRDTCKYITWIKSDITFEGLRQIIFEPEERVRIQEELPERKNDYQVIESIEIEHSDFGKQKIPLNPNLNAIIGGRSSGKSILLGCIAKKTGDEKHVKENNEKYEHYIQNDLIPNLSVCWRDNIQDTNHYIEFFPQSYINGLVEEQGKTNDLIQNIIKLDTRKKIAIDNYNDFCIENKSQINKEIADHYSLKEKLNEKRQELVSIGNKSGIVKQIESFKFELLGIKSQISFSTTESDESTFKQQLVDVAGHKAQIEKCSYLIIELESIRSVNLFNEINNDIISMPEDIQEKINESFELLKLETIAKWTLIIDDLIDLQKKGISISELAIRAIEENDIYKKYNTYYSQNSNYNEKLEKLESEEKKLNEINELDKEIVQISKLMKSKSDLILSLHHSYHTKSVELSDLIKYEKDEVLISCAPKFNIDKFSSLCSERLDNRYGGYKDILDFNYSTDEEYQELIRKVLEAVINDEYQLKKPYNQQQVLIDILSNNFYNIAYDVKFENDNLSSMSEGKKAFVILRILLDFNDKKCPILIDQPEDDLDNRAIYDDLVTYLRKKKKERQIILVTHNPNIVVGADAEEIIVANRNGTNSINQDSIKFEYVSGSLENSISKDNSKPVLISQGIKQHVCEILEGGDEAFRKREQKYGIRG